LGVPARNTNSQLPGAEQLRGIEDKVGSGHLRRTGRRDGD